MRTANGARTVALISFVVGGTLVAGCGPGTPLDPLGNPGSGGGTGTNTTGGAGSTDPGGATGAADMTGGAGSTDPGGDTGTAGVTGSAGSTNSAGATGAAGAVSTGAAGAVSAGGSTGGAAQPASCAALDAAVAARWIAFDSDRADFRRQLFMMHPDGTGVIRLLSDASIDKEPSFSPDGARVAFTSDRSGQMQIYVLDLVGKTVQQITKRPEGADEPSFSHDGKRVAFHSGASVYVVGADGVGETLVGTGLDQFNAYFWPHFSLDDRELVFDRNNEIDAIEIATAAFRRIVQNWTTTIKAPAVSPDGNDVAYDVYCEQPGPSIWTTPFSTTTDPCKGRRVTPPGDFVSQRPSWGTTSLLAYEQVDMKTNLGSIALINRQAGSQPCVITPPGSDNRNPAWSP
jgi:hypothetical protein